MGDLFVEYGKLLVADPLHAAFLPTSLLKIFVPSSQLSSLGPEKSPMKVKDKRFSLKANLRKFLDAVHNSRHQYPSLYNYVSLFEKHLTGCDSVTLGVGLTASILPAGLLLGYSEYELEGQVHRGGLKELLGFLDPRAMCSQQRLLSNAKTMKQGIDGALTFGKFHFKMCGSRVLRKSAREVFMSFDPLKERIKNSLAINV